MAERSSSNGSLATFLIVRRRNANLYGEYNVMFSCSVPFSVST